MNNIYLKNHIANRFINDYIFWLEVMSDHSIRGKCLLDSVSNFIITGIDKVDSALDNMTDEDRFLYYFLNNENNKNYLVTNTVIDKLELLKIDRQKMDWSVFSSIKNGKYTFILPDNKVLRLVVTDFQLYFILSAVEAVNVKDNFMNVTNHLFYIDKADWSPCSHMKQHKPILDKELFIYRILCFVFLSDIEEEVLKPGQSKGTKRAGKILNTFSTDLTIINSKWNITSIRTEGFLVSGHFAIRHTGPNRTIPKLVYIQPFEKKGYIRKAKAENIL